MISAWSFQSIWNQSLENKKERILEPRQRIWASELGGSHIDRYLKMTATPPTNPPNPRSRRKFEAGNIWENIIGFVLKRAGILIEKQEYLEFQYPNLLPVTGKLDFYAGGKPDYEKALAEIKELDWLPPFVTEVTTGIINDFKIKYPDGLKEIILEIKSCSSFMFENYERKRFASPQHAMQIFHYLKAKNKSEGHVVYICRDDARILEIPIFNPSLVEQSYKRDIVDMTNYIKDKIRPPLENPIVYEEELGRFSANWKVAYSQYLTMLYGLENQMAFDERYKPIVERWNRVLSRIADGKEMTKNNQDAIQEMKDAGFDVLNMKLEGIHVS